MECAVPPARAWPSASSSGSWPPDPRLRPVTPKKGPEMTEDRPESPPVEATEARQDATPEPPLPPVQRRWRRPARRPVDPDAGRAVFEETSLW